MEMSGQHHTHAALFLVKEIPVATGYEIEWASKLIWTLWRREKSFPYY
jgi:hypothetical protein